MPSLFTRRPSTPGLLAALCLLATPPRAVQSASSTPASRPAKIGGRPAQLAQGAIVGAVAQSPPQAVEPVIASAGTGASVQLMKAALLTKKDPVRVLMIGDSMTVGG